MGRRYSTEMERIASRWHGHRRILVFTVNIVLTWLFVFGVYALSVRAAATFSDYSIESEFSDPTDSFGIFYGLGIVFASILTPLYALHYLMSEIETTNSEMSLVREFNESRLKRHRT